ncbi:hypothetical protein HanIR_Chr05g0235531 [Helianthus annuus]|nr:hypothetical protein HanIR_Chr05g0235531 [Helianthus annuus]
MLTKSSVSSLYHDTSSVLISLHALSKLSNTVSIHQSSSFLQLLQAPPFIKIPCFRDRYLAFRLQASPCFELVFRLPLRLCYQDRSLVQYLQHSYIYK